MPKYELDRDGYAKVIFVDKNGKEMIDPERSRPSNSKNDIKYDDEGYAIIELEGFESEDYEDYEKDQGEIDEIYDQLYEDEFSIPPRHIAMVDTGKLTKEALDELDYAEVLRLATYKPAADIIKNLYGVRGVYLKNKYKTADGGFKSTTIKPHQAKTLLWMKEREELPTKETKGIRGGILHLTMGLGKTLIALIHTLSSKKGSFPTLVICSKTVMINWHMGGIQKFFGNDKNAPKVLYLHKDFMNARDLAAVNRAAILKYDIVVTAYDCCQTACKKNNYQEQCFEMGADNSLMKGKIVSVHERQLHQANLPHVTGLEVIYGTPWERIICDESQKFANPDTKTYKYIMAIYGKYKWCLTGTPIRNYDTDIWAQLRFCGYSGITQSIVWKKKGTKIFEEHNLTKAIFSMNYEDAGEKLPPKTKYLINIKLKGRQLEAYNFVLGETRNAYDKMMQNLCSFSCVLAMFTRLRQCAIAPYLITAESKREKSKGAAAKGDKEAIDLIKNMMKDKKNDGLGKWCHDRDGEAGIYSAKMNQLIDTISKVPKDTKVLIFSMFTSCLDLLAYALEVRLPDFEFVQIDGDTVGTERMRLLDQFDRSKTTRGAFFTYKVGGEGLNLTVATHCICIEPWWTPAVPAQAEARCWRIGQTKPVYIHNIIVEDTIENRILEICRDKEAMAASYLEGTAKPMGRVGLDKYTIGKMLDIR